MAFARAVSGAGCRFAGWLLGARPSVPARPSTVDWQLVGENQVACIEPIYGPDAQTLHTTFGRFENCGPF
jgi:hypothetical protein